jgi:sn-glycerol 3-phosphate transport system substrate-binding protein
MKAAGVECGFAFDYDTWMPLEQFSAIHNLPIATKNNGYDGMDAELVFNKTKFADYMKDWKKLLDDGVARIQTAQVGKTLLQAFADGTCASALTSVANHGVVKATAAQGLDWGVAMLPVYEGTKRQNSLVGGASLWVMQGKSKPEYEAAAAYLQFLATPGEALWLSTVTGYIPVTNSGFKFMSEKNFYQDPRYAGRELAIASLTATPPSPVSRGIRLGNFTQIRAEIRSELEAAFTGKKDMQVALDDAVTRGNQILRRFEQTYRGKQLP